jgi:hypothetical protein
MGGGLSLAGSNTRCWGGDRAAATSLLPRGQSCSTCGAAAGGAAAQRTRAGAPAAQPAPAQRPSAAPAPPGAPHLLSGGGGGRAPRQLLLQLRVLRQELVELAAVQLAVRPGRLQRQLQQHLARLLPGLKHQAATWAHQQQDEHVHQGGQAALPAVLAAGLRRRRRLRPRQRRRLGPGLGPRRPARVLLRARPALGTAPRLHPAPRPGRQRAEQLRRPRSHRVPAGGPRPHQRLLERARQLAQLPPAALAAEQQLHARALGAGRCLRWDSCSAGGHDGFDQRQRLHAHGD